MNVGAGPVQRLPLNPRSPWWGEHRSRYRFASEFVKGRRVLDIACGSGFGCWMLAAGEASLVVGADLCMDDVRGARQSMQPMRVHLAQADGTRLPFAAASFDVITSFETVEHIAEARSFVAELHRVLRPGGTLLLSTPNASITSRYPANPFHVREFTAPELVELLRTRFAPVSLLGQRLSDDYRVAPFLPGRERASSLSEHVYLWLWKAGIRMPFAVRDSLARWITGRPFYPQETDYRFEAEAGDAPVLVAVGSA